MRSFQANVASVLYNKTEGGVQAIDINTLGVLYVVENGDQVQSIADLKGKTLYLTGKGTTPDYVIQYLLKANGVTTDDVTLEYKSEATEVVAALAEDTAAIGLLPQPFVTAAMAQRKFAAWRWISRRKGCDTGRRRKPPCDGRNDREDGFS